MRKHIERGNFPAAEETSSDLNPVSDMCQVRVSDSAVPCGENSQKNPCQDQPFARYRHGGRLARLAFSGLQKWRDSHLTQKADIGHKKARLE
jgi:hypothetical protein